MSSFFHMVVLITGSCYFRVSTLSSNYKIMYIHYREFRIIEMLRDKKKSCLTLPSRNKHCCSFDTFSSSPYFPMHNFYCTDSSDFLIYHYNAFNPASGEGNGTPLQYSCLENPMDGEAWKAAVHGVAEDQTELSEFTFTFHFHALEKAMATHSSVLAWRIPGMGEPGGLQSMGLHRVGHD